MKQFEPIKPDYLDQNPHLVASLPDDTDHSINWHFLVYDNHLIVAQAYYNQTKGKWFHYQIEFPKRGLLWFLDTLQTRFFKSEAEGGLPKGQFHEQTTVDGEKLKLRRASNADGKGGSGYAFVTLDRLNNGLSKSFTFSDALLFDHGLHDLLSDIADRIRSGVL